MTMGAAKAIARQWLAEAWEGRPGFRGAIYCGSTNGFIHQSGYYRPRGATQCVGARVHGSCRTAYTAQSSHSTLKIRRPSREKSKGISHANQTR